MPGEVLLLFAFLIWTAFFLIYLSSPRSRMNRWCFASGLIFGEGVMKEYLYYELGPVLVEQGVWTLAFSQGLYSVLSALFYYFAMPPALIFCYYFCYLDRKAPKLFRILCAVTFVPGLIFCAVYPCTQVLFYQQDRVFCLAVALYDWGFGLIAAGLLIRTLWRERTDACFRQRLIAAAGMLIPLFCWLTAAFPYHVFGGGSLSKLWQGNVVIVAALVIYILFHMTHGGIWGMRVRWERYDWPNDAGTIRRNARYVGHTLKNELSKIEWSLALLEEQGISAPELEVIGRSSSYLKRFVHETQIYSDEIFLHCEEHPVREILEEAAAHCREDRRTRIEIGDCAEEPLLCDRLHLTEVLKNLLLNGAEAAGEDGAVWLCYECGGSSGKPCIRVRDNGQGIGKEEIGQIFDPYYTTKGTSRNMGLGLYYCRNVMLAHKGRIEARSEQGEGSEFTLWFPKRRKKKRRD
ncbi:MAG: HAMP domain-containing sensor histidine kinase [Eubacteriales bacterium]|nr:HAMP domain-containing sensor histidine kinase [Eubacteriales bacterium]